MKIDEDVEENLRRNFIHLVQVERIIFESRVNSILQEMQPPVLKRESLERLNGAKERLLKIVEDLGNDLAYNRKEDVDPFNGYMDALEGTIKNFFRAYLIQENLTNRITQGLLTVVKGQRKKIYYSDSIDSLTKLMYDSLAERRGIGIDKIQFGYPAVIRLIKFVKNREHHQLVDIPLDYRTKVRSFGNLYTLSCMLILCFYAYVEMLEAWNDTIKNFK